MSLLELLKKNENARKIFGKRELKIIEKQILGVNLTQSEKNRLSRDIRKKLEFIKEASKYSDEFELKKGTANKEIIKEAVNEIKKSEIFPRIKKIVLFGSAVDNEMTLMSDIDIAIEFDKITDEEAVKIRSKISGQLSDKLDIQIYNILPDKIKKQIDAKGKVLYQKNG